MADEPFWTVAVAISVIASDARCLRRADRRRNRVSSGG
jgi:hypothetical protein